MSGDLGSAMDEFSAVNLTKTGAFDLEFFVEAQSALASAVGQEPDAIASTSCFFDLTGIMIGGNHPPRDIFMRWQANQDIVKNTAPELLAPALRRVAQELLERRKEHRPVSRQGERALLDTRTRELALIEASSEDRTEQHRQKEAQAAARHAASSRRKAGEQNVLAMFARERGDKEAQQKALDGEFRFLRQAASAEAEARRRMGGHGRRRG